MIKNEERFTGKADIYGKFRSSYTSELIDHICSLDGFSKGSVIADIGSGTGILSRLLLERGNVVYCVEPNDDMRKLAENDLGCVSGFKNFISVNASAENTGLEKESIDFITVAQAFHWFDEEAFKLECNRILRNNGKVILVWNTRDYESEIIKSDFDIRKKYCIDTKGLGVSGSSSDLTSFYADGVFEKLIFKNDLSLDCETYIGMNLSRSYAPKKDKDPEKYQGMVKELHSLFDKYSVNGLIYFPQFTECYIGNV